MLQAVSIYTTDGQRFDLNNNETYEVNMGGISLLNLADRTATYTNTFKLPLTPTNQRLLSFASDPTSNARPTIDVIIQSGVFTQAAKLKVVSFDKDNYSCSVAYTSVFDVIKTLRLSDIQGYDPSLKTYSTLQAAVENYLNSNLVTPLYIKTSGTLTLNSCPFFYSLDKVLKQICETIGYTAIVDGSLNFGNDFIFVNYSGCGVRKDSGAGEWTINTVNTSGTNDKILVVEIMRSILQTYLADIYIDDQQKTMTFEPLSAKINGAGIQINGFTFSKLYSSGLAAINKINYTLATGVTIDFCGDSFAADGQENKDLIKLKSYIPLAYTVGGRPIYDLSSSDIAGQIICGTRSLTSVNRTYLVEYSIDGTSGLSANITAPSWDLTMVNIAGVYSSILNPIFANPVILDATGYLDTFTAHKIMAQRVILSVQLGGRYWVDTMAYNLATGNTKMKLIKL